MSQTKCDVLNAILCSYVKLYCVSVASCDVMSNYAVLLWQAVLLCQAILCFCGKL